MASERVFCVFCTYFQKILLAKSEDHPFKTLSSNFSRLCHLYSPHRRFDQVCAPGYQGCKRGESDGAHPCTHPLASENRRRARRHGLRVVCQHPSFSSLCSLGCAQPLLEEAQANIQHFLMEVYNRQMTHKKHIELFM